MSENFKNYYRVTEILGMWSGLATVDPEILKRAADRGTQVHDYIELYLRGQNDQSPNFLVEPYFKSFLDWFTKSVKSVHLIEHRFFDTQLMVTGKCDVICRLKGDDCLTIIDFKTPQVMHETFKLQTAAYFMMAREQIGAMNGLKIERRGCLQLFKDGSAAFFYEHTRNERDEELFVSAAKLYRFFYPKLSKK